MSEPIVHQAGENGSLLQRLLHAICISSAAIGGLVIFGAAFVVTYSVLSSTLGFGAVRGEFELVGLACACSASLFLPLCQLNRGHVMVDVFTSKMPIKLNYYVDTFWTLIFALGWAFICWFLIHGMIEIHGYGDRFMLLRWPVWWAYVPAIFGTGISAIVALLQSVSAVLPRLIQLEAR